MLTGMAGFQMRHLLTVLLLVAATHAPASESVLAAPVLNQLRQEAGLPPLAPSTTLERAARMHAEDMVRNGFFSHTGTDGSRVAQRANRVAYPWCSIAENIAMGQRSVSEVMRDWMKSPSHRKNILNRRVVEYGLVRGPRDTWVLVLGRPGCWSSRLKGT